MSEAELVEYDRVLARQKLILFILLMYNDTFAYLAGMSSLNYRTFFLMILVAQVLPALALAYIGSGIRLSDPVFLTLCFLILILAVYYLWNQRLVK